MKSLFKTPRCGIVGAGAIGRKRAANLGTAQLCAVADLSRPLAEALAAEYHAMVFADWRELVQSPNVDIVIVCTTHDALATIAEAALRAGKAVLVEKPGGVDLPSLRRLAAAEKKTRGFLRVGFNHRFHPAFLKLKTLMAKEEWGPLLYIRARYGHGGRLGYEKEWRADPRKSGGGELMDQGVHLIDLCRWIGGEFNLRWGTAKRYFWNMPVEDNGFLFLESPDRKRSAFLHASCTEWKNLFDFEIFFKKTKAEIAGLGRSYGEEELRVYRMTPKMGPPDLEIFRFPGDDTSWAAEFDAFLKAWRGGAAPQPLARAADALKAVALVAAVYKEKR